MPHERAMIDMPIGLKMSGHRECDIGARELVGPSVFPTGGYANPTYTIIALAMRAADHLGERLSAGATTTSRPAAAPA